MKIVEGIKYYSRKEVAQMVDRTAQMVDLWRRINDIMESEGKKGFIPKPIKIGEVWYWSEKDIEQIRYFANLPKAERSFLSPYIKMIRKQN